MTKDASGIDNAREEVRGEQHGVFMEFETDVLGEWLDYNEHMNDAAYALALTAANEAFLDYAEIGAGYRADTGCTLYTVEAHIYYLAEVHATDHLKAQTEISELSTKKLKLSTTLFRADGEKVARSEFLYLHYNQQSEKVVPFPDAILARLKKFEIRGNTEAL